MTQNVSELAQRITKIVLNKEPGWSIDLEQTLETAEAEERNRLREKIEGMKDSMLSNRNIILDEVIKLLEP